MSSGNRYWPIASNCLALKGLPQSYLLRNSLMDKRVANGLLMLHYLAHKMNKVVSDRVQYFNSKQYCFTPDYLNSTLASCY